MADLKVRAPFTALQCLQLARYQLGGWMHPFTCRNRGDGRHPDNAVDIGVLIPTPSGWVCASCDYTQDWAHAFMLEDQP